jgi:hypothetical protein
MPVCEISHGRAVGREYRERAKWKYAKKLRQRIAMEMESIVQHVAIHFCVNHKDALSELNCQSDRVPSQIETREITDSVPKQATM